MLKAATNSARRVPKVRVVRRSTHRVRCGPTTAAESVVQKSSVVKPAVRKEVKPEEVATCIHGLSVTQDQAEKAHGTVEMLRDQAAAIEELHRRAVAELDAAKKAALAAAAEASNIGKAHRETLHQVIALGQRTDPPAELMEALQTKAAGLTERFNQQMEKVRSAHDHVVECEAVAARTAELLKTAESRVAIATSMELDAMNALHQTRSTLQTMVDKLEDPEYIPEEEILLMQQAEAEEREREKERIRVHEEQIRAEAEAELRERQQLLELQLQEQERLEREEEARGSTAIAASTELKAKPTPLAVDPVIAPYEQGLTSEQLLSELKEELWQIWIEEPQTVKEVYEDERATLLKEAYQGARSRLAEKTLLVAILDAKVEHLKELCMQAAKQLESNRQQLKEATAQVEDAMKMQQYWTTTADMMEGRLELVKRVALQEQLDDLPAGSAPAPVDDFPQVLAAVHERDAAQLEVQVLAGCIKDLLEKVRTLYAQTERDTDTVHRAMEITSAATKALQSAMWDELQLAFEVVERQHHLEKAHQLLTGSV